MDVNHLNFILEISTALFVGLMWCGIVTFLRLKKKKSLTYLLFFTIFYVYIVTVLYYTLFQFQYLLFLKYFTPGLMLRGIAAGKSLNLTPLITFTQNDIRTSFLNILLMMPFGFGLPFITNLRMKRVVVIGALFSIGIELLQLVTGVLAKMTFRIADINDVIFNTIGVAVGYILFVGFVCVFRHVSRNWKMGAHPILRYIAERPQIGRQRGVKTISILILIIVAALFSYMVHNPSQETFGAGAGSSLGNGQEGMIPKSGDLCNGTGGTGQIVSTGDSTITIRRKDGVLQTITLTTQTEIRNSAGPISESDLKIGDHVTVVILNANQIASTVLVCNEKDPPHVSITHL